jgi:hypothetical protein
MAAVTQIRRRHSQGRACYDKKLAGGKTPEEAMRALKRQISDAIFTRLRADARRAAAPAQNPGGQPGNDTDASAAGLHPARRLFGQAAPGSGHQPTTAPAARGRARHSPVAALLPPATPGVKAERPQRSGDERPGRQARRQPHPAARKAPRSTAQHPAAASRAERKTTETP